MSERNVNGYQVFSPAWKGNNVQRSKQLHIPLTTSKQSRASHLRGNLGYVNTWHCNRPSATAVQGALIAYNTIVHAIQACTLTDSLHNHKHTHTMKECTCFHLVHLCKSSQNRLGVRKVMIVNQRANMMRRRIVDNG